MKLSMEHLQRMIDIFTELETDKILKKAVQQVSHILNAKGCSIFLFDEASNTVRLAQTTNFIPYAAPIPSYQEGEGLTGWVFKWKRPLLIQDLPHKTPGDLRKLFGADIARANKFVEGTTPDIQSFIAVPMISQNDKFYGILRSSSMDVDFSEEHLDILSNIASYISVALENSTLFQQERQKANYFRLLTEFGTKLHTHYSKTDILNFIAEQTALTFNAETCEVYLRDEKQPNLLILRSGYGIPQELIDHAVHEVGEGLTGTLVEKNAPIRLNNVLTYNRYKGKYRTKMKQHLKYGDRLAFLGIPLRVKTEVIGCLKLYNKIAAYPGGTSIFSEDDENYLGVLGIMLGVALENLQYLESMQRTAIQMVKNQRLTALGTMAIRLPNEITNSLTTAHLNVRNLLRKLGKNPGMPLDTKVINQLLTIDSSLQEAASGVKTLQEFSLRAGFLRMMKTWEEIIDEGLLFLSEETLRKKISIHRKRIGDEDSFPQVMVEPNEMIEVIINLLMLAMNHIRHYEGDLAITIWHEETGNTIHTDIRSADHPDNTPLEEDISYDIEDNEMISPQHFMLQVAREIITNNYQGTLDIRHFAHGAEVTLIIPVNSEGGRLKGV